MAKQHQGKVTECSAVFENLEVLASPLVKHIPKARGLHSIGIVLPKPDTQAHPHSSQNFTIVFSLCKMTNDAPCAVLLIRFLWTQEELRSHCPREAIILPIALRNHASRCFLCLLIKKDPLSHEVGIIWKSILQFILPFPPGGALRLLRSSRKQEVRKISQWLCGNLGVLCPHVPLTDSVPSLGSRECLPHSWDAHWVRKPGSEYEIALSNILGVLILFLITKIFIWPH